MKVFSNTMLIDFTQSLKKRIKNLYQKTRNEHIKIDQNLLKAALRDAAGKLTAEYLDQIAIFLKDVIVNNFDQFQNRVKDLKSELDSYRVVEEQRRVIGFAHNEEKDKTQGEDKG